MSEKPTLGTAASQDSTAFATAAQGTKAESAVQPKVPAAAGNLATLDINGKLGDSGKKISDFATAAQGTKAESAVQPEDLGTAAEKDETDFATAEQGAKAETAVQPRDIGTAAAKAASDFLQLQSLVTQIINSDIAMALGKKIFATDDDGTKHILAALVRYGAGQLQSELGDPRDPMCLNTSTVPGWSTDPHIKHTHKDMDGVSRDDRLAWVSELTALINDAAASLTSTYSSTLIEQKLTAIISGDELGFLAFGRTLTSTALPAVTTANNGQKLWDFQTNTLYTVVTGAWNAGVVQTPQNNAGIDIIKMLDGVDEGGNDMTGHKVGGIWSGTAWSFGIDNNTEYTFGGTFKTNADGSKDVADVTLEAGDIVDDNTKYTATVSPLAIFNFLKSIPRKINALFTKASLQQEEISDLQDVVKGDLGDVDITTASTAFATTAAGVYKINWTGIQATTTIWPTVSKRKLPNTCSTILIINDDANAQGIRKQLATFIGGFCYTMKVKPAIQGLTAQENKWRKNGSSIEDQNGRIYIKKGNLNTPRSIALHVNGRIKSVHGFDLGEYDLDDTRGLGDTHSPNKPRIWSSWENIYLKARQIVFRVVQEIMFYTDKIYFKINKMDIGRLTAPLQYINIWAHRIRIWNGRVQIGKGPIGSQSGRASEIYLWNNDFRDVGIGNINNSAKIKVNDSTVITWKHGRPRTISNAYKDNMRKASTIFWEKPLLKFHSSRGNIAVEFAPIVKTGLCAGDNNPLVATNDWNRINIYFGNIFDNVQQLYNFLEAAWKDGAVQFINSRPSNRSAVTYTQIDPILGYAVYYTTEPLLFWKTQNGVNTYVYWFTKQRLIDDFNVGVSFVLNGLNVTSCSVIYDSHN